MKPLLTDTSGFTLIELLIAMLVTGLLMGAVFNVYQVQTRTEVVQNQLVDMQQNLRVGLEVMAKGLRPAGFDPVDLSFFGEGAGAGVLTASPSVVSVTMDLDGNGTIGGAGETATFAFAVGADGNGDGTADNGRNPLGWDNASGNGRQPFIDGIEAVGFAYAIDADEDGRLDVVNTAAANSHPIWAIDTDGDGMLDTHLDDNDDGVIDTNDTAGGVALGSTVQRDRIRAVRIWLLARGDVADPGFSDPGAIYVVADRRIPGNDGFRRRLASTIVKLRNM